MTIVDLALNKPMHISKGLPLPSDALLAREISNLVERAKVCVGTGNDFRFAPKAVNTGRAGRMRTRGGRKPAKANRPGLSRAHRESGDVRILGYVGVAQANRS